MRRKINITTVSKMYINRETVNVIKELNKSILWKDVKIRCVCGIPSEPPSNRSMM